MQSADKATEAGLLRNLIAREMQHRDRHRHEPNNLHRLIHDVLIYQEMQLDIDLPRIREYITKMEAEAIHIQLWQLEDVLESLVKSPLDKLNGCDSQDTYFWRVYQAILESTNCPCCAFWRGIILMGLFNIVSLILLGLTMK